MCTCCRRGRKVAHGLCQVRVCWGTCPGCSLGAAWCSRCLHTCSQIDAAPVLSPSCLSFLLQLVGGSWQVHSDNVSPRCLSETPRVCGGLRTRAGGMSVELPGSSILTGNFSVVSASWAHVGQRRRGLCDHFSEQTTCPQSLI